MKKDKKISMHKALNQVKYGMNDRIQDFVNLDYAGMWLKVIDEANQKGIRTFYIDEDGILYY